MYECTRVFRANCLIHYNYTPSMKHTAAVLCVCIITGVSGLVHLAVPSIVPSILLFSFFIALLNYLAESLP